MSCKDKIHRIKRLSENLGANAINFEEKYNHLIRLIKDEKVKRLTFVLPDGQKIQKRVVIPHGSAHLYEYYPRSRKYVRLLSKDLIKNSLDVEWKETRAEMTSERDQIRYSTLKMLSVVEKIANAIKKYKHPNLDTDLEWLTELDYEKLAEQITTDVLEQYDQYLKKTGKQKIAGWEENYFNPQDAFRQALKSKVGEKSMISVLPFKYKLIALTSYPPELYRRDKRSFIEEYIQKIKAHLDNKEPFRLQWRSTYDITVATNKTQYGVYTGSVALEYKGLLHGHYCILLDENHALWVEED